MGFAVVHLEKAKGTDSGMSAHIERTIAPKNADKERTHLNREEVHFNGKLFSREHCRNFETTNSVAKIAIDPNDVDNPKLHIDNIEYYSWFEHKKREELREMDAGASVRQHRGFKI